VKLSSDVKEENINAIFETLRSGLHVADIGEIVQDQEEASEITDRIIQVGAWLWRYAPILWTVNDWSNNSAIKQALGDLGRESLTEATTISDLKRLGLKW
jgi:hypothetical protein